MKPILINQWILQLSYRGSVYDVVCLLLKREEKNTDDFFCLAFRDHFLKDNFLVKHSTGILWAKRKRLMNPSQC